MFSGKWIFGNTSNPLYKESCCLYMSNQLACHKHGMYDLGYQYWRWQPHYCNLKRYSVSARLSLVNIVSFAGFSFCYFTIHLLGTYVLYLQLCFSNFDMY